MSQTLDVFNERQAAKYLGLSESTLRLWRTNRTGPTYFKAGARLVRYRRSDLDRWIEARLSNRSESRSRTDGNQR